MRLHREPKREKNENHRDNHFKLSVALFLQLCGSRMFGKELKFEK
jgi:hypothetical protein